MYIVAWLDGLPLIYEWLWRVYSLHIEVKDLKSRVYSLISMASNCWYMAPQLIRSWKTKNCTYAMHWLDGLPLIYERCIENSVIMNDLSGVKYWFNHMQFHWHHCLPWVKLLSVLFILCSQATFLSLSMLSYLNGMLYKNHTMN